MRVKGKDLPKKVIEELGEIKLVGFRVLCEGEQYIHEIPKAASQLKNRIGEISQIINSSVHYGAFMVDQYAQEEDGYWIGVQVKEHNPIPEGMCSLTIPPQRYVVSKFSGANDKIRESYTSLHEWIEENGFERQLNKWHLERYYGWSDANHVKVDLLDTIK